MPITALPTAPSRADPENFAVRSDNLLAALATFVSDANTLQVDVNAQQAAATAASAAASASSLTAAAAAGAAVAAIGATTWVSGATYAVNANVVSPASYFIYRRLIAGAGSTDPASDTTNWQRINQTEAGDGTTQAVTHDRLGSAAYANIEQLPLNVWPVAKSAAYAVTADDRGKTLVVSGTTTITLPPASTAFDPVRPFCITIKAKTSAVVTVARQGSDVIDTVSGNKSMTANTALTFFPISTAAWETI